MSIQLHSQLIKHIKNFDTTNNGKKFLHITDMCEGLPTQNEHDFIQWGENLNIIDIYYPEEGFKEDIQNWITKIKCDDNGCSKVKSKKRRPYHRVIELKIERVAILKLFEILLLCGSDVTNLEISKSFDEYLPEIIKYLPKLKEILKE